MGTRRTPHRVGVSIGTAPAFVSYVLVKNETPVAIHHDRKRLRRHDTAFLIAVAVLSILASMTSFYVGQRQNTAVMATTEDGGPRVPLPAGPRKYQ